MNLGPQVLGELKQLTYLYLFDDQLSGEIRPELGYMTARQVLYVSRDNPRDRSRPGSATSPHSPS